MCLHSIVLVYEDDAYWDFRALVISDDRTLQPADALLYLRVLHGSQFSNAHWQSFQVSSLVLHTHRSHSRLSHSHSVTLTLCHTHTLSHSHSVIRRYISEGGLVCAPCINAYAFVSEVSCRPCGQCLMV